jgi:hypothetical protein
MSATGISLMHAGPNHANSQAGIDHGARRRRGGGVARGPAHARRRGPERALNPHTIGIRAALQLH